MLFVSKKEKARCIVDVHCHIMPGVDDGSVNMAETLKMLKLAKNEGITHMIATPHYKSGHRNASPEKIRELLAEVKVTARQCCINMELFQGNEILYHEEMCDSLNQGRISRMNGSNYVLVEYMPSDTYQRIRNSLDEIMSEGYQPIVAHIERYNCMSDDIENVMEIRRIGAEIQVNASSIVGDSGKDIKKFVHSLLKEQMVDYVGTDAHHCEGSRTPQMTECCDMLYKKYDEDYVNEILYANAMDRLL
ncbi:MAG: CpsB/CapC family capsule biosynthesis tyrosine phosphatase [Lachnospira sp.]